jgi:hypothetical protein
MKPIRTTLQKLNIFAKSPETAEPGLDEVQVAMVGALGAKGYTLDGEPSFDEVSNAFDEFIVRKQPERAERLRELAADVGLDADESQSWREQILAEHEAERNDLRVELAEVRRELYAARASVKRHEDWRYNVLRNFNPHDPDGDPDLFEAIALNLTDVERAERLVKPWAAPESTQGASKGFTVVSAKAVEPNQSGGVSGGPCEVCHGSGIEDNSNGLSCTFCDGTGVIHKADR